MKKAAYPIVVLDEQQDQLDEIVSAFRSAGVNCDPILYDAMNDESYTGIELLFLDVNLAPAPGQDDNAILSILANVITTYIAEDNGPYVLIFWTTRPELIPQFKDFAVRDKDSKIYNHRPIYVDVLPKDDFIVQPRESIDSILNLPIVKLVFSLHKKMHEATTGAFKELINCIPLTEHWGDNDSYIDEVKKVFTKIAVTSVGKDNASLLPDKAILEVVGKEVLHHLVKNASSEWKDFLGINPAIAENAKNTKNNKWQYNLNTVFHVENNDGRKTDRGAVLTAKKWAFDKLLGKDWIEWSKEEFGFEQSSDDKASYLPIALEISASCDYAQGNPRLNRFILGLCRVSKERPSNNIESCGKSPFKKLGRHNILPTFFIKGQYYKLVFSYNYVVGVNPSEVSNFEKIFTLRDEITINITSGFAGYASRIGYVNINES